MNGGAKILFVCFIVLATETTTAPATTTGNFSVCFICCS